VRHVEIDMPDLLVAEKMITTSFGVWMKYIG